MFGYLHLTSLFHFKTLFSVNSTAHLLTISIFLTLTINVRPLRQTNFLSSKQQTEQCLNKVQQSSIKNIKCWGEQFGNFELSAGTGPSLCLKRLRLWRRETRRKSASKKFRPPHSIHLSSISEYPSHLLLRPLTSVLASTACFCCSFKCFSLELLINNLIRALGNN